jgi:hypothetical protein
MQNAEIRPRFAFQIFYIEWLSRMTPQAQNACLKFFEEPKEGNIIICTDISTSWILDTILSRVQYNIFHYPQIEEKNIFFSSLIRSSFAWDSSQLIEYFFSKKLEKQQYIDFLKVFLYFLIEKNMFWEYLDELQEDISGVIKNNLQGKYVVDKWILRL